jgi:putative spermidine/putrescine transport system substrate-binding protein
MARPRLLLGLCAAASVILALAGCGSSSGGGASSTGNPAASSTETAAATTGSGSGSAASSSSAPAAASSSTAPAGSGGSLVVAGYGGTTAPLQDKYFYGPFGQASGVNVKVNLVPGQQVAGISAQNAAGHIQWDLTLGLASGDMSTLYSKGYLATMPDALRQKIAKNIPDVQPFGVPSKNGAVLIVCNSKLVAKCPTNAKEFFDTKDFPGARMLPSFQPEVAIALALEAQGVAKDAVFPSDAAAADKNLTTAFAALDALKPSMKVFYSSSSQAMQLMQSGEVVIAGLWNSASQQLSDKPTANMTLTHTWQDAVTYTQWDVVYKGAPDEANAWKFIEWLADNSEQVAKYAAAAPSGTTDQRVYDLLPKSAQDWVPAPSGPRAEQAVNVPALWVSATPERQTKVSKYWASYTQG